MNVPLDLRWEIGHQAPLETEVAAWVPARVPGCAQQDIGEAQGLPDFRVGSNVTQWTWLEERSFVYRTRFARPALSEGEQLFFHSDGIDYEAAVILNGNVLLRHVGPYSPIDVDLTAHLRSENELLVEVAPVPRRPGCPADRTQAAHVVKPAVGYSWDFHPRLIPSGMWAPARVERRAATRIDRAELRYELSPELDAARLTFRVSGARLAGQRITARLWDATERIVQEAEFTLAGDGSELDFGVLEHIALWWPRHHGTPVLYRWQIDLLTPGASARREKSGQVGFRRVRLLMNEGAWKEPAGFPKGRSVAPIQFEINGRRIFVKGSNWVPPEVFTGSTTAERYAELIDRAGAANLDLLRVWGGGGPAHEAFYDHCDRHGMLVWQEFPLACNEYPDTADYLALLRIEAQAIVRRLRLHPCLAVWCGGNELFNFWSGMTDQALPLRTLGAVCLELDPGTPFLATSPLEGMSHGYYRFRDPDTQAEVFQLMARSRSTAYAEFGVPGPSPVEALKAIIPPAELWPPQPGTAWETHHAFAAWTPETWLDLPTIEHYFGPTATLEVLVERGQLLQAEGLKCIYEEARRQKPYCSLAMNWCLNEPWPCAANGCLIAYPNQPKPAYAAVASSCRPVLASARIPKFVWQAGERFSAEFWLLNDRTGSEGAIAPGTLRAWIDAAGQRIELLTWSFPRVPENTNLPGPTGRAALPAAAGGRLVLHVQVDGRPEWSSTYTLLCRAPETAKRVSATPLLNQSL